MTSDPARSLDYLSHLAADSTRFLEVIRLTDPDAAVPSCPGWTADDLLYHLAEVQQFWATVVGDRLQTEEQADAVSTARPPGREALLDLLQIASGRLLAALSTTPPETAVWSWADDHTAAFSYRRQAHEALIHRIDAELTAGVDRDPVDPALAADGVAEALDVMFGEPQDWLEFRPDPGAVIEVVALDTGDRWVRAIGHAVGTSPSGKQIDWHCLERTTPDAVPTATLRAGAADLDCWLWNRPPVGEVAQQGDADVLASFRQVVGEGIQ